jgi:hypothetical protein
VRILLVPIFIVLVAGIAAAQDLGIHRPDKVVVAHRPSIPSAVRQGGDTITTATAINSLPFTTTGTTSGYWNDYDEACPYTGSDSPDVVYELTVDSLTNLDIDLGGSAYDTKTYVYDQDLNVMGCNDDFHWGLTSYLECIVPAGRYYIVVDGYGGDHGAYALAVRVHVSCPVECPTSLWGLALIEHEPPLVDGYRDTWNGGCDSAPGYPIQPLYDMNWDGAHILCGVTGWYVTDGLECRDTDWMHVRGGFDGVIQLTAEVESATRIFALTGDCYSGVTVAYQLDLYECEPGSMSIYADEGEQMIIWIAPMTFAAAPYQEHEYEYVLWLSGMMRGGVATEPTSWGNVKAIFAD